MAQLLDRSWFLPKEHRQIIEVIARETPIIVVVHA
jgi:hypothetical protein